MKQRPMVLIFAGVYPEQPLYGNIMSMTAAFLSIDRYLSVGVLDFLVIGVMDGV